MYTEEKLYENISKLILVLLPLPLFVGTVGYHMAGHTLADAVYYSICLYGLDWDGSACNGFIEAARWTAPLLTVAGLATVVKNVYSFFRRRFIGIFHRDGTAIYSDSERAKILNNNIPNSVLCGKKPLKHVRNHIILFDSDEDNLLFYQKYQSYFQDGKGKKTVYLCLNEVDSNMLKSDMDNVRILNANDIIARSLWKDIKLWNTPEKEATKKVAILGFDSLGQRILRFGLQMNLYGKKQCVEYHVFGESELYRVSHENFQTMNRDQILFHGEEDEDKWSILKQADVIIAAGASTIEMLQSLHRSCEKADIYYYCPTGEKITDYIRADRLFAYGEDSSVFSYEHIRTDELYESAKKLNYAYCCSREEAEKKLQAQKEKEMEEEWRKLDGFTKGSNISSSDFGEVIRQLDASNRENNIVSNVEEFAELEHIRWCRYHLLNGWKYGIPENGKNKDMEKRIHKCLLPYADLPEEEKEKDRQVIKGNLADECSRERAQL